MRSDGDSATHLVNGIGSSHHLALVEHEVAITFRCIFLGKVTDDDHLMASLRKLPQQRLKGAEVRDGWVGKEPKDAITFT